MEIVTTWIKEGATFDGLDFTSNIRRVVAIAVAENSTHQELAAQRTALAASNWNLAMPGINHATANSVNFHLLGTQTEARLTEYGTQAEAIAKKVRIKYSSKSDKELPSPVSMEILTGKPKLKSSQKGPLSFPRNNRRRYASS